MVTRRTVMLNPCMNAFSGRRISKVTSWGCELGFLISLNTSVEAYRSWIFEVTWNLVRVGSPPSDTVREVTRGKRKTNRALKSLSTILNALFWENQTGGVWARTPQTRLADKPQTTWTLTLPMTHLWLPIIQGIFVKSPTNTCSWAWLSLFVYSRITIAYINIEFLIWLNMESKFMFLTKGVLCQKYVLKL